MISIGTANSFFLLLERMGGVAVVAEEEKSYMGEFTDDDRH